MISQAPNLVNHLPYDWVKGINWESYFHLLDQWSLYSERIFHHLLYECLIFLGVLRALWIVTFGPTHHWLVGIKGLHFLTLLYFLNLFNQWSQLCLLLKSSSFAFSLWPLFFRIDCLDLQHFSNGSVDVLGLSSCTLGCLLNFLVVFHLPLSFSL